MQQFEKPQIFAVSDLDGEQVFAKNSGNNGRWGSGNPNSNNGGIGHGSWDSGGKNHDNHNNNP